MAIRDRVRRALHKSSASESEPIQIRPVTNPNNFNSSGSESTTPSSLHRANTNLTASSSSPRALWSWTSRTDEEKETRRKQKEEDKEKARQVKATTKPKSKGRAVHPRDKPLTAQNLKHQEMLSGFTFEFGSSPDRMSQICSDFEWSPCCTRAASIDGDNTDGSYTTSNTSTTLDLTRSGPVH